MFQALLFTTIFLTGLGVGSFLNSVIHRLKTGQKFLLQRSHCPYCRHILSWQDLIPILSFLILKGKCRYCHQKISWQYPLVEFSTACLFLSCLFLLNHTDISFGSSILELFFYWLIFSFLIIIFVYDLKHYLIPNQIIYPAMAIAILYSLFEILNFRFQFPSLGWGSVWNLSLNFIGGLGLGILPSFFLLAIILFSGGKWMGFGDFKLAILMGFILGWPNILVALLLAFFIGAIIGIGLIISGKKTLKSEVPFGPFLVTGTFIALFFGREIVSWYLNSFLL